MAALSLVILPWPFVPGVSPAPRTRPGKRAYKTRAAHSVLRCILASNSFLPVFCQNVLPACQPDWFVVFFLAETISCRTQSLHKIQACRKKSQDTQKRTPHTIFVHKFQCHTDKSHETGQHPWPGKIFPCTGVDRSEKIWQEFFIQEMPPSDGGASVHPWQVPLRRRCFSQRVRRHVRSQDDSKNLRMGNRRIDSSFEFFVRIFRMDTRDICVTIWPVARLSRYCPGSDTCQP